jgi:hypothetical protein
LIAGGVFVIAFQLRLRWGIAPWWTGADDLAWVATPDSKKGKQTR